MTDRNAEEVSDEMLMALADGELDSTQATALRARIAADPDLAARHAVFAETGAALRSALSQRDVPQRLIDAIENAREEDEPDAGNVVAFPKRAALWPIALAASLALGVGLGWGLKGSDAPGAAPALEEVAQAVSDVPTGGTADIARLGSARVVGSFETDRGLCRLIAFDAGQEGQGRFVACRKADGWDVALSVADGSGGGYAPASGAGTEVIDHFLDTVGAGPALDPEAEAESLRQLPR